MTIAGKYFPEGVRIPHPLSHLTSPKTKFQVILSVNPWVIHRNKEIFGQDSERYNPNRWLQGDTKKMDAFLIHVNIAKSLIILDHANHVCSGEPDTISARGAIWLSLSSPKSSPLYYETTMLKWLIPAKNGSLALVSWQFLMDGLARFRNVRMFNYAERQAL